MRSRWAVIDEMTVAEAGEYQVQAYFAGKKVGPAVKAEVTNRDLGLAPIVVAQPNKEDAK